MYNLLTRDQLHTLHELLYLVGNSIYNLMFDADYKPSMHVLSDEWQRLYTARIENSKAMRAVYEEMERRDAEEAVIAKSIYRGFGGTDA